ncbi:rCG40166 [Rattus norvegicus]|uniref:RCG40166 n=1 Tax=Rattus norvegicus TaxID=10116 RepID=A6I6E9_RAT|nr:rCG40166 [Rattus norvegicus]
MPQPVPCLKPSLVMLAVGLSYSPQPYTSKLPTSNLYPKLCLRCPINMAVLMGHVTRVSLMLAGRHLNKPDRYLEIE